MTHTLKNLVLCIAVTISQVPAYAAYEHGDSPNNFEPPFIRLSGDGLIPGLTTTDFAAVADLPDSDAELFRQGITAIHGFWTYHAERVFRELQTRHPDYALAYAFAAYAQLIFESGDEERAKRYFAEAKKLRYSSTSLTPHQIAWIDAIGKLFNEDIKDNTTAWHNHAEGLKSIVYTYPEDYEAKAFLALYFWLYSKVDKDKSSQAADENYDAYVAGRKPEFEDDDVQKTFQKFTAEQMRADRLIEEVLAKYPNHPVHHYKIHVWDTVDMARVALDSARKCGPANPAVAHLWHMPGHIYRRLGTCSAAHWHFATSQRVDHTFLTSVRIQPEEIHNYAHNFDYMADMKFGSGAMIGYPDLVRSALSSPRKTPTNSFLVKSTFENAVNYLTAYEMWEDLIALQDEGYFDRLYYAPYGRNAANLIARAKSAYIMALYHTGQFDKAESEYATWAKTQLITPEDLSTDDADESITLIRDYFVDLSFHREIAQLQKYGFDLKGALQESALLKSANTGLFSFQTAWYALEAGYNETALKIAKDNLSRYLEPTGASFIASLAYAEILRANGQEAKANNYISKACMNSNYELIPKDLRLFNRMSWAKDKIFSCKPAQLAADYFQTTDVSSLGSLTLAWPDAPSSYNELRSMTEGDIGQILIFSLGANCELCNKQTAALKEKVDLFKNSKLTVKVISSENQISELDVDKGEYNTVDGKTLKYFKDFKAFDEFIDKPVHGVFIIDRNGKMRFYHASEHALTDIEFIHNEAVRLINLPAQK